MTDATYWTYILASKPYGTLYIGVTNNLLDRVEAHRAGIGSRFTARYGVKQLVYYEPFNSIEDAIQREKTLKHWVRQWKINLIESENPHWRDVFVGLQKYEPKPPELSALGGMGHRDKPDDDT